MGRMMRAKAIREATESAPSQNAPTKTTVAVSVILMMQLMPRKRPVSAVSQASALSGAEV